EDDVVDGTGIDAGALDERADRVRAEVGRVHAGERAASPSDRRAHRVDDVGLSHDPYLYLLTTTDEPWPNSPWLAVTPTVAPSTWRAPASPRSCHTTSHTCAIACAGIASPKHASPPLGFTGIRPPTVVAPERSNVSASP